MPSRVQPNILLITTDQQRFDTIGPSAPSYLRTPHLDHLAREGITFNRAYADSPLCVPSRVAIMTGRSVHSHRMATNGSTSDVLGNTGTLPAVLGQHGYHTAAIGKMHFTPQRARHGFAEMLLPEDYYNEMRRGPGVQPMRHGLGQNEIYPGMATVPEAQTLTSWIAERCVDFVRDRRDPTVPFFLWASFSKPHPPLDPPEPYYSMYQSMDIPEPVVGDWAADGQCPQAIVRARQRASADLVDPDTMRAARAAYYGLVTQVDYTIGRIFAALQDVGLFDDMLILFTSDHGDYLGDHQLIGKVFFHESSARIPMVLRLPQTWADRMAGTTVDVPVTLADVMPTLVGAADGAADGVAPDVALEVDGVDLVSLARSRPEAGRVIEATACGFYGDQAEPLYLAITDGRWKYVWYPEGGVEQLFDLVADPTEQHDLARDPAHASGRERWHSELVERHRRRSSEWVDGARLRSTEVRGDTVAERRNASWPGYHTERYQVDVRH